MLSVEQIVELADEIEYEDPETGRKCFDRLGFARAVERATRESQGDAAVAAIQYALEHCEDEADIVLFLTYWNEGEFDKLRRNWREIPEAVFIGAEVAKGNS